MVTDDQRKAAGTVLRSLAPAATGELGELFERAGRELALVGGSVRDAFLGGTPGDLDLTTERHARGGPARSPGDGRTRPGPSASSSEPWACASGT